MQLAGKLQSTDKKLSDDEALQKAAAILSNSAYLNAEQRAHAASSKQLEAILAPLNMQLGFAQDEKEQQKIINQMNMLQQQFLDRQAKLKGGIASVPSQGSSVVNKYKVEKES
jgi:predicted  nucleic acid-binding Zn-ribbon protein